MKSNQEKLPAIKRLLETGQYRVDPYATADAILRRMQTWPALDLPWPVADEEPDTAAWSELDLPQRQCSYPDSFRVLPLKVISPRPSATEPIHVRPAVAAGEF